MAASDNVKLENVPQAFDQTSDHGQKGSYDGRPSVNKVEPHIQGMAYWKNYCIFSHNSNEPTGKLLIVNTGSGKLVHEFDTPVTSYNHPGGIQVIGDFLVVPIETVGDEHQSVVCFYNLSKMDDMMQPVPLPLRIERNNKKAGYAGITNFKEGNAELYLLAIGDNGDTDFYISNGKPLSDPACDFKFSHNRRLSGFDGCSLVTNEQQHVYFIGFRGIDHRTTFKDEIYLYEGLMKDQQPKVMRTREVHADHGSSKGKIGVHFRYGGGLKIVSRTELMFYCCQRNFVVGQVFYNHFCKK